MKKHYEGSNILFLESGAHTKSQIFIAFISIMVYLKSGKILNIWEESR